MRFTAFPTPQIRAVNGGSASLRAVIGTGPPGADGADGADGSNVLPTDTAVAALLPDLATLTGAQLAALLLPKITNPSGATDGDSLLSVGGGWGPGRPNGTLTLNSDGSAHTILSTGSVSTEATAESGAGFPNCYAIADPIKYPAAQGALAGYHFIGGDVYGTYMSTDAGDTWTGANYGKFDIKHFKTASIEFCRAAGDVNKVVCLSSNWNTGNSSSVTTCFWQASIDTTSGRLGAWSLIATLASTYRAQGDGATHPRQTGRMIVPDPLVSGRYFVCLEGGVLMISGGTVTAIALTGGTYPSTVNICTGMDIDAVKDPATGIDLYVTVRSGTGVGVWKIANAQSSGRTVTQVTGTGTAPAHPENLRCVAESGANVLYIADGLGGNVIKYAAGAWSTLTTGLDSTILCKGLDAVRNSGDTATTVLVSHDGPDRPNLSKTAWSTDGGSTWTVNLDSDSDYTLPNGQAWWLISQPSANGNYRYYAMEKTGAGWDCPDARIDPNNQGNWYVIGRSSPWRRKSTDTTPKWHPICVGIGATVSWDVATHPTIAKGWLNADGDWSSVESPDFGLQPRSNQKSTGSNPLLTAITSRVAKFDGTGIGFVGQSNDTTHNSGRLWWTGTSGSAPVAAALTADNWYEILDSGGQTLAGRMGIGGTPDFGVRGLVRLRDPADNGLVIIPLLGPQFTSPNVTGLSSHAGIWRMKCNSAGVPQTNWTQMTVSGYSPGSLADGNMPKYRGSSGRTSTDAGNVYMFDPTTSGIVGGAGGLYRSLPDPANSNAIGTVWTRIWPKLQAGNMKYATSVKCDPIVPNRLIVTVGTTGNLSKVWRIDNAHDGTLNAAGATLTGTIAATDITGTLDAAGAVCFNSQGDLFVHQCASGSSPLNVGFYKATSAQLSAATSASAPPWVNVAGNRAQGQALFVTGMEVSFDDRYLFASSDGFAVMVHDFGGPATSAIDLYTKPQVLALLAALTTLGATLTDLNAVTGADGDFLERISGHWVNRTKAQVKADLSVQRAGIVSANAAMLPSATANTDGTPVTITIPTGYVGIGSCDFDYTTTGVSSETITVHFAVTYDDASTTNVSPTSTTNTTVNASASQRRSFRKQGRYITAMTVAVKSSITSSAASVAVNFIGEAI